MEVREELKEIIEKAKEAAIAAGELPEGDYAAVQRLEVPKSKEFGDYSTNAAMQWARTAHKAPRMIAESIVKHLDTPLVTRTEIAGAGFINFYLAADTVYSELKQILKAGPSYGDLPKNKKDRILVEYVSANPTGLLHIGHARGAAYGSSRFSTARQANPLLPVSPTSSPTTSRASITTTRFSGPPTRALSTARPPRPLTRMATSPVSRSQPSCTATRAARP